MTTRAGSALSESFSRNAAPLSLPAAASGDDHASTVAISSFAGKRRGPEFLEVVFAAVVGTRMVLAETTIGSLKEIA